MLKATVRGLSYFTARDVHSSRRIPLQPCLGWFGMTSLNYVYGIERFVRENCKSQARSVSVQQVNQTQPPSITKFCPVIVELSPEARKRTRRATSSGISSRFKLCRCII